MGQARDGGGKPEDPVAARRRAATAAVFLGSVAALAAVHLALRDYGFDDAFIHFRIAANLVATGSPHFNPGEPVAVSSAPAWTLLVAAILGSGRLFGVAPELPAAVAVLNAVATLAGARVYVRLLGRVAPGAPRGVAGLFAAAYVATLLPASIGLMETPFALLVAGFGLRRLAEGNAHAFAWLAAAVCFRPELVVVLALAGLVTWRRGGAFVGHAAAWAAAVGLPFAAWQLACFGTLVPQAVRAKAIVYDVSPSWVASIAASSLVPAVGLGPLAVDPDPRLALVLVAGLLGVACATFLGCGPRSQDAGAAVAVPLVMLAWGPVLLASYVAARTFLFPWYVPLYAVPVLFAAADAAVRARRATTRLALALLALPLLSKIAWLPQAALAAWRSPAGWVAFEEGARVRHYVALGRLLAERYPGEVLLTSEIGGLGYGFSGRIADAAGLATPAALAFHPMRVPEERRSGLVGAIPPGFVEAERPGLVVTYDGFAEAFLRSVAARDYRRIRRPLFLDDDLARTAVRRFWESGHLNVFVRRDLPVRLEGRAEMIHPERHAPEERATAGRRE